MTDEAVAPGDAAGRVRLSGPYAVRTARVEDLDALVALEATVWGDAGATREQLAQRLANVPGGNLVAVTESGLIVAYTAFCRLDYDDHVRRGSVSWYDLSGDGTAGTHVEDGPDLFGISLGALPEAPPGASVAGLVEVTRLGLVAGCRRGILGARLPGYARHADSMSVDEYIAAEIAPGVALDPELRFYDRLGLQRLGPVKDYFRDPDSLDWGLVVMLTAPWPVRAVGRRLARTPLGWSLVRRIILP